jgi:isopenicillin-N epimerase
MNLLRDLFMLDPGVVFLNHGSFGATPRPVFDVYQAWQRELERQPVAFMTAALEEHLAGARAALGRFVNAPADDLVYVPNVTYAVNAVARSLALGPGDEVLATDHEYGACDNVWRFLSRKRGFAYCRQAIPLAMPEEEMVETFWEGVTPRTRVIFMSHITSPTALRLPAEAICERARAAGILTVIDAAHAVGQIPLDLAAIGADFYTSNAHKWLCAPKGAGFLYARREVQQLIEPLIVGWGWGEDRALTFGSDFLDAFQWPGTDDFSAYLSVPAAIRFQEEHDWPAVRARCHELAGRAIGRIGELTGLPGVYTDDSAFAQMAIAPLPPIGDLPAFKRRLYDEHHIEVPCVQWGDRQFIRLSIQGYNTEDDINALLAALGALLANALIRG